MKRIIFLSVMMLVTIASFGRKHVENATVVADTIFYAENMSNVANADQAAYYRILMTTGSGITKKNVFQDFYMNGNLRAEGDIASSTWVMTVTPFSTEKLLLTTRMVRKSGTESMSMANVRVTLHCSFAMVV